MQTQAFESWGHWLAFIREQLLGNDPANARFIFRGQRDADWRLEPTLDRFFPSTSAGARSRTADKLLNRFKLEASFLNLDQDIPEDDLALKLLARHHGLPTTVLDFSASPLRVRPRQAFKAWRWSWS